MRFRIHLFLSQYHQSKLVVLGMKSFKLLRLAEGVGLILAWFTAMFASISIRQLAFVDSHSICGPWGCGPSTGALIAIHVGWLTALWPPLLYLPWRFDWNYKLCRWMGILMMGTGIIGVLGIVAWQWLVWLPQAGEFSRSFLWQRCGFVVATSVDWPLAQLAGIGAIMTARNRTGPSRKDLMPQGPVST